jgi:CrcB protein
VSALVWLGIAVLGGAGALARFGLDAVVSGRTGREFPWGTFAVNVSGAFALGLLVGLSVRGDALALAGTGALGSYTTFSTWMLEAHRLGEDGEGALAAVNVVASLAVGVGAAALGRALA